MGTGLSVYEIGTAIGGVILGYLLKFWYDKSRAGKLPEAISIDKEDMSEIKGLYEAAVAMKADGNVDEKEAKEFYGKVEAHVGHRAIKLLEDIF